MRIRRTQGGETREGETREGTRGHVDAQRRLSDLPGTILQRETSPRPVSPCSVSDSLRVFRVRQVLRTAGKFQNLPLLFLRLCFGILRWFGQ